MIRSLLFVLLACGLLCLFSCTPEQQDNKFRIGFSQCSIDAWRDVMEAEMYRELAFHPEVDFEMRASPGDSKLQIRQIRELIAEGVDLMIISPNESAPLTPIVEEIYQSGTPVILIDRKTDSESYTAYIGADNYEIGKTAGEYIAGKFNGKGKILELQMAMSISPAVERNQGFRDAIAAYPDLEVPEAIDIQWGIEKVDKVVPDILRTNPGINIVFGHTDLLAERAFQVAQKMGRADTMFFVGVDGIPGTGRGIQAVEDGVLDASMLYILRVEPKLSNWRLRCSITCPSKREIDCKQPS